MANSSEGKSPSGMEYPASSSGNGSDTSHMHDNEHPFNTSASEGNLSHTSEADSVTGYGTEGNETSTEDRVAKEILFYEQRFQKMPFPHLGIFNFKDLNIDWRTATSAELATLIAHKNRILTDNCDLPRPQNFVLESNSDGIPSWRQPTLSVEEDPEIDWMTAKKEEDDASCSTPPRVSVLQDLEIDWRTATFFVSQENRQDVAPLLRLSMQQPMQVPYITDLSLEDKTGQHPLAVQSNSNARASFESEDEALKVGSNLERMLFRQTYMAHTHRNLIRMHEMERECHKLRHRSLIYWMKGNI